MDAPARRRNPAGSAAVSCPEAARQVPGRTARESLHVKWLFVAAAATVLWSGGAACGASEAGPQAAWQRQEMEFTYLGFTTRYSCEGLRHKLRALLLASGARPDLEVRIRGCPAAPGDVTDFPRVRMVFHSVARPAAGAVAAQAVDARWKRVEIGPRQLRELEAGDCELVEQFRDRVLPAFVVRGLEGEVHCIPHRISASAFHLRFESLQGAPGRNEGAAR